MAEEKEPSNFLGYSSFQEFYQTLLKSVVQCTRASNEVASTHDDHEFWTSFEEYKEFCAGIGAETLNMIGNMLQHQGLHSKWQPPSTSRYPHTDIEDRFESVVEGNDMLLERVDAQIDEILCPSKANKPLVSATEQVTVSVVSSWNKQTGRKKEKAEQWRKFNLLTARNIQRPQLKWKRKIDNSNAPFVPILTVKPNAIKEWKPAERFREQGTRNEVSSILEDFIHQQRMGEDFDMFEDRHPYKFELDAFEPRQWQLEKKEEQLPKPLEDTPLTIIDDTEQLQELLDKLKKEKEIAIDLEHHSYRSFLGFTCLMQISTRTEDFLVDTISLREDLFILNEVFTDPNILKVLHGAEKDIEWLQRDFGLYIVNMFDTGQAAKVLQLERHSLAFLLNYYCEIDANKQYQLADWRLRPIPDEMVKYAREDTHYLLYIYDKMRNSLIEKSNTGSNILNAVYSMSKVVCSRIYEKPIFTPDTYVDICNKYKRHLNPQQLHCMKLLVAWRDHTARQEDESYGYVLPNHMMLRIAEQLPKEPEGVLACCNPVPPLVKQNVAEISILAKEARLFDPRKVSKTNEIGKTSHSSTTQQHIRPVETIEGGDFHSSTLTGYELYPIFGPAIRKLTPSIPLFKDFPINGQKTEEEKKARFILESFRSPFELYLPKVASSSLAPTEINKKWIEATNKEKRNVETVSPKNAEKAEQRISSPKRDASEISSPEESHAPLRDEVTKKKRKLKKDPDSVSNPDSPVTFSYEKAATGTEFVPFDYSKAKIKKSDSSATQSSEKDVMNFGRITEEPLKKGIVNDRRKFSKSGERSMTFKRT